MNIAVWALQAILAASFLGAGLIKATKSRAELQPRMAYVEDFSDTAIRTVGILEVLAAVALILPAALRVATILTPLAAAGLVVVMIGAVAVHLRRGETDQVAFPAFLLLAAAVVAWARFGPYAI